MTEKLVYTRHEVAALLMIQPRTVTQYACQGTIPPTIARGRWSKAQVDEYLRLGTWTGKGKETAE